MLEQTQFSCSNIDSHKSDDRVVMEPIAREKRKETNKQLQLCDACVCDRVHCKLARDQAEMDNGIIAKQMGKV